APGELEDAVGAGRVRRRRHFDRNVSCLARLAHFVGVGRDDQMVQHAAAAGALEDMLNHRLAADRPQHLASEPGGMEACWNDAENAEPAWHGNPFHLRRFSIGPWNGANGPRTIANNAFRVKLRAGKGSSNRLWTGALGGWGRAERAPGV